MERYIWGIDIGGTAVKIGLFRENGDEVCELEIDTIKENGGAGILPDVGKTLITYMNDNNITKEQVLGIGLAVPGPVDTAGVIYKAVNLGWGVFNVEEALREITGIPVFAGNDANLAALGETWKGASKGHRNSIMITLGTGIGGGIISEGVIVSGHKGGAGELGHIHVNSQEREKCRCGNFGCVEQYASAPGIVRMTMQLLKKEDTPSTLRGRADMTSKDVFDAAKDGDSLALKVVDRFGKFLGQAVGIAISTLAPDVVVIGGGVSKAGAIVIQSVDKYYRDYTFHVCKEVPVVLAQLGNNAGMVGAARLVIDRTNRSDNIQEE